MMSELGFVYFFASTATKKVLRVCQRDTHISSVHFLHPSPRYQCRSGRVRTCAHLQRMPVRPAAVLLLRPMWSSNCRDGAGKQLPRLGDLEVHQVVGAYRVEDAP